jgi:hypothetical protein
MNIARRDIEALQAAASKLPQVPLLTQHFFADGMYLRALFRPKDTLIVGKVHKREHFYLVLSGKVTIVGNGDKQTVSAPHIFVSLPGTKRAVYAEEDSLCATVHRTDETDLQKIEAELIEPDESAMYLSDNSIKGGP